MASFIREGVIKFQRGSLSSIKDILTKDLKEFVNKSGTTVDYIKDIRDDEIALIDNISNEDSEKIVAFIRSS